MDTQLHPQYLIQSDTLVSIAEEARALSGTTSTITPEEIKEKLNGANSAIQTEADLIAQILAALNGKVNKTFTFYIKGEPHTAERGMTWKEWCASDYNTTWFTIFDPQNPNKSWISEADDHIYYDNDYAYGINIIIPGCNYDTIFNSQVQ